MLVNNEFGCVGVTVAGSTKPPKHTSHVGPVPVVAVSERSGPQNITNPAHLNGLPISTQKRVVNQIISTMYTILIEAFFFDSFRLKSSFQKSVRDRPIIRLTESIMMATTSRAMCDGLLNRSKSAIVVVIIVFG